MNRKLSFTILLCLVIMASNTFAYVGADTVRSKDDPLAMKLTQQLSKNEGYVWPKDQKVLENLKKWQGYKFGLLIHMAMIS